eukprot:CAMPEP_0196663288 /NCGR_PEP_ID=MMETSP1086-20130531/52215_1 /TAXON_ID=77921 /ORGANISM="Cyanoptyche  gloeocystis , Strain SAG4.97" /LENGTH=390 /DNA_ID=CAMNT_0041999037 /DNA_START=30 /DNA_END=1202 /DNA_ORIENTATION=+
MNIWQPLKFSSNSRPILVDGEVECLSNSNVTLDEGDKSKSTDEGSLILTSYRLLHVIEQDGSRKGVALFLSLVSNVGVKSGFFQQTKIVLGIIPPAPQGASGQQAIPQPSSQADVLVRLAFRSGGHDVFLKQLRNVLQSKSWESRMSKSLLTTTGAFSTTSAGVGGIIRKAEQTERETEQAVSQSFTDLKALMQKAKDMVVLADRFRQTAESTATSSEKSEFGGLLLDIGVASVVTRQSAGAASYHQELARQLADVLHPHVEKAGGMLTLRDAYCIINRARGTDLLSPDDLLKACSLFESPSLSLRLRRFDSGVLVVHSLNRTDEQVAQDMRRLVDSKGPLGALDVAMQCSIALALALEQLLTAERLGLLCRDETVEGLRFFPNAFPSFQ